MAVCLGGSTGCGRAMSSLLTSDAANWGGAGGCSRAGGIHGPGAGPALTVTAGS